MNPADTYRYIPFRTTHWTTAEPKKKTNSPRSTGVFLGFFSVFLSPMAILSALKNRLSQVFSGSQTDSGDETQATGGSSSSNLANSVTFVEDPDVSRGLGPIQRQGLNSTVVGQTTSEKDVDARPLTGSQFYDDEEWANGLCKEEIEAGMYNRHSPSAATDSSRSTPARNATSQPSKPRHDGCHPMGNCQTKLKRRWSKF